MDITKHNVREVIEDYLKTNRIRYTTNFEDSKGLLYELYVGSLECYLQVEYNLDNETDDSVFVQLFTETNEQGDSLYHSNWDSENVDNDLETEIEELIQQTKMINSTINKIRKKIEDIEEICEENNLDIEEFITVNYDFDK